MGETKHQIKYDSKATKKGKPKKAKTIAGIAAQGDLIKPPQQICSNNSYNARKEQTMIGIKPQSKDGEPRVATALKQLDINYEIDPDGDFKFGFNLEGGRSQLGFIRSGTYEFAGVEMREIFSVALRSFGPFDARTTNILLEYNSKVKIGAWSTLRDAEDNHIAVFSAKIAADLTGELLMGVIVAVLTTADEIEQRLCGRDDF